MTDRYLTINLQPDWKAALGATAQSAKAQTYQGEVLSFESPSHFFGRLNEKRWAVVLAALGKGEMPVRDLAHVVGRNVQRVREDVVVLAELGVLECTDSGGVLCPYASVHIDMRLEAA